MEVYVNVLLKQVCVLSVDVFRLWLLLIYDLFDVIDVHVFWFENKMVSIFWWSNTQILTKLILKYFLLVAMIHYDDPNYTI